MRISLETLSLLSSQGDSFATGMQKVGARFTADHEVIYGYSPNFIVNGGLYFVGYQQDACTKLVVPVVSS